jgi:hypothetical protein
MADREDSASQEAQASAVLAMAERIVAELESSPERADRNLLLLQASFLNRLAAALLLEPDFPALPGGFGRLLDRDRARTAARQLADSRGRQYRSYTQKGAEPTPRDPNPGRPYTAIDLRLAAQTAATLQDLEAARLDLFREYLQFANRSETSNDPEVCSAALALLARYWQSQGRLLCTSAGTETENLVRDLIERDDLRRLGNHLGRQWSGSGQWPAPEPVEAEPGPSKERGRFPLNALDIAVLAQKALAAVQAAARLVLQPPIEEMLAWLEDRLRGVSAPERLAFDPLWLELPSDHHRMVFLLAVLEAARSRSLEINKQRHSHPSG